MVSTVKAQSRLRAAIHQAAWPGRAPEAWSRPHTSFWKEGTAVGAPRGSPTQAVFQAGLQQGAGKVDRPRMVARRSARVFWTLM